MRWDNRRALSALSPSKLAPNLLIGARVKIADNVEIGANVVLYDDVILKEGVQLDDGAVLGRLALRNRGSRTPPAIGGPTILEEGAIVAPYALVSAGVRMGPHSFLGDHAHLREGALLGADVVVGAGCGIGRNVEIGDRTRMQNHCVVGPNIVIEPNCFFGPGAQVLTGRTMSAPERVAPPVLRRGCQIGAGVQILPGVEIGEEAIVGAGSVVAEDVPAGAAVRGVPARLASGSSKSPLDLGPVSEGVVTPADG
jgi:UDP-2-acetamido-3-amino-2,3-dideoxy-glucuronate N-acetyltransferase